MNPRVFENFRLSMLCRLLAAGTLIAGLGLAGCGTPAKATDNGGGTSDDLGGDDLGSSTDDVADAEDVKTPGDVSSTDIAQDTGTDQDVPDDVSDTTAPEDVAVDTGPDTPDAKPDVKKLPICDAAKGSCALCQLCGAYPVCTLKELGKPELKTYANDCQAICALNAYNWPQEVGTTLWPAECPACPFCTPGDMKKTNDEACVTLASGLKQTVDHQCEIGCVQNAKLGADGKTPVSYNGVCKAKCTDPVAKGGAGCPVKGQPICAKEDNGTYTNTCKMENCDVAGCFPAGATAATSQCAPGAMTKECDGGCFDAGKTPNCTNECNPVCGIKSVTLSNGQKQSIATSYRSQCVAAADGASVGSCDGITMTPTDVCAAQLLYKSKGCCDGVEYGIVHPLCATQTVAGKPDLFVTFQNQGEYNCLTAGDPSWTVQYQSACICNCTNIDQPVCGANGFTYQNACQADCYNPPKGSMSYTPGPC